MSEADIGLIALPPKPYWTNIADEVLNGGRLGHILMADDRDYQRRLSDAKRSLDQRRDQEAFRQYSDLAKLGNAEAQFYLGFIYINGLGIEKDISEDVKWYLLGANQGNIDCQSQLGWNYAYGDNIQNDLEKARHWYGVAAESGDPKNQFRLAEFLALKINMETSLPWYEKSASQGYGLALLRLAYFHNRGIGVKKNKRLAFDYYRQATEKGNIRAQVHYAIFLICGYEGISGIPRGVRLYVDGFATAIKIFRVDSEDERIH
ncbi:MAG: tetratricopeptide repeat protein [Alphaproteobacteria bacterium]|nr:tetratricopeptide repeat protein [Alphaproteobacteria bacterium]